MTRCWSIGCGKTVIVVNVNLNGNDSRPLRQFRSVMMPGSRCTLYAFHHHRETRWVYHNCKVLFANQSHADDVNDTQRCRTSKLTLTPLLREQANYPRSFSNVSSDGKWVRRRRSYGSKGCFRFCGMWASVVFSGGESGVLSLNY